MNNEEIREYCLSKPDVTESLPFNDTTLVFKVMDRMFVILDLSEDSRGISLKCDPELAAMETHWFFTLAELRMKS